MRLGEASRDAYDTQPTAAPTIVTAASASRRAALVALALPTLIWSYNWIVMKQALAYSGPFEFSALRYIGGSVVLFVVLMIRGEPLRPPRCCRPR